MRYDVSTALHQGQRDCQEDAVAARFAANRPIGFAVLADGMGGHAAGDIASAIVVEEVARSLDDRLEPGAVSDDDIPAILHEAATSANASIASYVAQNRDVAGMGATLIAPVVHQDMLHWISVGDSPLYVFSEDGLRQVNEDHSMAPQIDLLVRAGMMDAETARNHPDRNCLTSVLMGSAIPRIDWGKAPVKLVPGDIVIASSDGLQFLTDEEIQDILGRLRTESSAVLAKALVASVQSLGDPDQDNISVAVIKVS
ncbi:protein phosphatase 2C domain-containing protein [Defluviimonas sp. D31]|uniref:PP2C family protein-serine/threonine phosphatase n=1 Tax=Defluviimonas sp. D31 TaxID=3083253 RepID=UPI00296FCB60|nr:protein phosphatase 2C domain-containing protein [Defluviimonas sp. D31]MDW4550647.1 protein phosphatase 2C domain-containing protein [Defluviimonas sp. D31]